MALVEREAALLAGAWAHRTQRMPSVDGSSSGSRAGSGAAEVWHEAADHDSFLDALEDTGSSCSDEHEDGAAADDSWQAPDACVWGDACDLACSAAAAIAACSQPCGSDWLLLDGMLDAAGGALAAASRVQPSDRIAACQSDLRLARHLVRAARLLARNGLAAPMSDLHAAAPDRAHALMQQLLAHAEGHGGSWDDQRWAQLWRDAREVQGSVLSDALPAPQLAAMFLRAALLAGRHRLAAAFLPPTSEPGSGAPSAAAAAAASRNANWRAQPAPNTAEAVAAVAARQRSDVAVAMDTDGADGLLKAAEYDQVAVDAARQLLRSAASLEDPSVDSAANCLALIPHSDVSPLQADQRLFLAFLEATPLTSATQCISHICSLPPPCLDRKPRQIAQADLEMISALRRLPEFGVSLPPAQLLDLQTEDRRGLLHALLTAGRGPSKHADAPWQRLGDVLEMAALLGLGGRETEVEVGLRAG